MAAAQTTIIHEAKLEDRQRIANLIHFEILVHRHLDWRSPLDWIDHPPYLLAEQGNKLIAALACPPNPPTVAWIRLFAVSGEVSPENIWEHLWSAALSKLNESNNITVAAIPLQDWFQKLLQNSGFILSNKVVMLIWDGDLPPERSLSGLIFRPMNIDDLPSIEMLDGLSFGPIWHNSLDSLELAFRQAIFATVAEFDEKIIGYMISTSNNLGGHLARLAIHPQHQKQGIGYCLLRDTLEQFKRRGAHKVTVNTQEDNVISLSLYQKFGFKRTKEDFPVYIYSPNPFNDVNIT
jgi:ribosomal protein S18 acetylase RimI-like enzyme